MDKEECLNNGSSCAFAVIINSRFVANKAHRYGGAILTGYLEAIRTDCSSVEPDWSLTFLNESESMMLSSIHSEKDFCASWKENNAKVSGSTVGSFASMAMVIVESGGETTEASTGETYVIKNYASGTPLPTITVRLLDGLHQESPISYHEITATLTSPEEFLVGDFSLSVRENRVTYPRMVGFGYPGIYNLTISFNEKVMEDLTITVEVRNCTIGEVLVPENRICSKCSSTSYNFDPTAKECQPCPENGNCETTSIVPNEGYWQSVPCSEDIQRCLTSHACEYDTRDETMRDMAMNTDTCNISYEQIEEYRKAQCAPVSLFSQALK